MINIVKYYNRGQFDCDLNHQNHIYCYFIQTAKHLIILEVTDDAKQDQKCSPLSAERHTSIDLNIIGKTKTSDLFVSLYI